MKNSQPLISIITVVYNGAKTIERTIKSIRDQDYDNIEYLIIDGGSTDNTLSIVRDFGDTVSKCISEKDNGIYDAMNKGIALANGELIGMINSDDWYEEGAVSQVVKAFIANRDKKIFHGDRFDVDTDGTKKYYPFKPNKFKFFMVGMIYNHPSFFVHKSVYENQVYDTDLKVYADYHFTLYHYLNYPQFFHHIPIVYVNYSLDGYSGSYSLAKNLKEGSLARKRAGLPFYIIAASIPVKILLRIKRYLKR